MEDSIVLCLRNLQSRHVLQSKQDIDECLEAFETIILGKCPHEQIGAFLTAIRLLNIDRDAQFVAGAVSVMRKHSLHVDFHGMDVVDIVGTGGDGQNTFNVSTAAGLICASAGITVCKHGNRASTSTSGSADLLHSLGAPVTTTLPSDIREILQKSNFAFLFAPTYHPCLAAISSIRRNLGFPTIFNLIGPLLNPAPTSAQVIGVSSPELGLLFANTLYSLGQLNAFVVCGFEGLDEVSIAGPTHLWQVKKEGITEMTVDPSDFGLQTHSLTTVSSGTPEENADLMRQLASGWLVPRGDPHRSFVVINAALLVKLKGIKSTFKECAEFIEDVIDSGSVQSTLQAFIHASKSGEGYYGSKADEDYYEAEFSWGE